MNVSRICDCVVVHVTNGKLKVYSVLVYVYYIRKSLTQLYLLNNSFINTQQIL